MKGRYDTLFERIRRSEYYRYEEIEAAVGGRTYRTVAKMGLPGWPGADAAQQVLAEGISLQPTTQALVLGCGCGLAVAAAAGQATQGHVQAVDHNSVAVEATRRTVGLNRVGNVSVELRATSADLPGGQYDVVLIELPKGREPVERALAEARRLLRVGGAAYLAGANTAGIKGYARALQEVFGEAEVVLYRHGARVVRGRKRAPEAAVPPAPPQWQALRVPLAGREVAVATAPGIFSWQELDAGTGSLLAAMPIRSGDRVLDLGCGNGILGLAAALKAKRGRAVLVDSDVRAVEAARETLRLNGVQNAEVRVSDGIAAVREEAFDAIVTNLPFHAGVGADFSVPLAFIVGSAQVLAPRGRLYLVANRFIKYEPYLESLFRTVQPLYEDNQFKVLEAIKA